MNLTDNLVKDGWLYTPRIIEAFRAIKRADFMIDSPDDIADLAELNEALPIGFNQTISQPLTVAFMLEKLQPKSGDRILDVGSGSGWTTALLSFIVGEKGRVTAVERIPELKEFGEKNVLKYNFIGKGIAEFICADGSKGCPGCAPFDAILVSASAEKIPEAWREQLKIGGRIVAPVKSSILVLEKQTEENWQESEYPGFAFVPLVQE